MRRRRALLVGTLVAAAVVLGGLLALATTSGENAPGRPDPVAAAYARGWQATCRALRADAARTAAALRSRIARGRPSAAVRRRLARSLVAPYLGRTERRLRRQAAATPPPPWRAYHRDASRELLRAVARTGSVRARVRAGDLAALDELDRSGLTTANAAPAALRAGTPACAA